MEARGSLLIVDDDLNLRERLARAFARRGFEVRTAAGYEEALRLAEERPPERAIIDLRMPGRSGLELLRDLLRVSPRVRVLVLTGYGSIATAVDAVRLGAVNYVPKPADADDLLAAFARGESGEGESDEGALTADSDPAAEPVAPSLARAEWEHIQRVLADCEGNISAAARRLGIHRRSLQRKLQKYAPI